MERMSILSEAGEGDVGAINPQPVTVWVWIANVSDTVVDSGEGRDQRTMDDAIEGWKEHHGAAGTAGECCKKRDQTHTKTARHGAAPKEEEQGRGEAGKIRARCNKGATL